VVVELAASLNIPVVWGAPIGHGRNNEPVIIGAEARVRADDATAVLEL